MNEISSKPLCADQVRYLWSIADLKLTYSLLRKPIGFGHALMQAQLFEPGVREKGLNEAAVVGRIFENAPIVSAVSAALA